jgi:hypothetical protein
MYNCSNDEYMPCAERGSNRQVFLSAVVAQNIMKVCPFSVESQKTLHGQLVLAFDTA